MNIFSRRIHKFTLMDTARRVNDRCVWKGLSSRLSKLRVLPVFQVKRIPEYEKYLTELLQGTPEAHPDYEQLSRAVKKVQDVSIPTPVSLL